MFWKRQAFFFLFFLFKKNKAVVLKIQFWLQSYILFPYPSSFGKLDVYDIEIPSLGKLMGTLKGWLLTFSQKILMTVFIPSLIFDIFQSEIAQIWLMRCLKELLRFSPIKLVSWYYSYLPLSVVAVFSESVVHEKIIFGRYGGMRLIL